MKAQTLLSGLIGLGGLVEAGRNFGDAALLKRYLPENVAAVAQNNFARRATETKPPQNETVENQPHRFLNKATKKYSVDGRHLPEIDWNVGESYAGNMPISDKNNGSEAFFWFFPTPTKEFMDKKEIVIWLNGGPGCSSLLGFLEENGPVSWGEGMSKPKPNPFSFHLLTNVVWVEQPIGVGFTKGHERINNEDDISAQFIGFWKNFMTTFGMEGWKVYIAGESYAGMYGPYLAKHMLDQKDKRYYDMSGLLVYDGISFGGRLQFDAVAFAYLDQHYSLMPIGQPEFEKFKALDKSCGFYDVLREYLVYPPKGVIPANPPGVTWDEPDCDSLFDSIQLAASVPNPCFNVYNIVDRCPQREDPLSGKNVYYNRPDVKRAIHADPNITWHQCNRVFTNGTGEHSPPAGEYAFPQVIEQTNNVIIAEGTSDYLLSLNGILLGIQNMTWNGKLGFQEAPTAPFYVPNYGSDPEKAYDDDYNPNFYGNELPAGFGVMGTTHYERGLSFVVSQLAGHEGPEYTPAASMRILEKLLGRIKSLDQVSPFTLPQISNITQPTGNIGNGTVAIPCFGRGC